MTEQEKKPVISIHIEWMDGRTADIDAVYEPVVHEGVLRIQRPSGQRPVNFPVSNIRNWE